MGSKYKSLQKTLPVHPPLHIINKMRSLKGPTANGSMNQRGPGSKLQNLPTDARGLEPTPAWLPDTKENQDVA